MSSHNHIPPPPASEPGGGSAPTIPAMWRLNASSSNPKPPARDVFEERSTDTDTPPLHVSLVSLVGQLLVLAQGGFAVATGVNLLRGAQTLGDVSAGFKPLGLSQGTVQGIAIAGIAVGALFMIAGLRVRRLSLRGRVPIALTELVLLLISSVAIAVGGENVSVISVAVLAFAGSPILPGAALLGVEAIVIHALLIHPGIDTVRRRRRAAALRPQFRTYLPAQTRTAQPVDGSPAPRYAGPAPRPRPPMRPLSPQISPARPPSSPPVSPARAQVAAELDSPAPKPESATFPLEPSQPKLRVMPPVSPRLVVPARDANAAPAAALDLPLASARGRRPAPEPVAGAPAQPAQPAASAERAGPASATAGAAPTTPSLGSGAAEPAPPPPPPPLAAAPFSAPATSVPALAAPEALSAASDAPEAAAEAPAPSLMPTGPAVTPARPAARAVRPAARAARPAPAASAPAQPAAAASARDEPAPADPPHAPDSLAPGVSPAQSPTPEPSPFIGLRPAVRKPGSKRAANQPLLRPARGAGAELRDIRLKPELRPRVLPLPDDDDLFAEE